MHNWEKSALIFSPECYADRVQRMLSYDLSAPLPKAFGKSHIGCDFGTRRVNCVLGTMQVAIVLLVLWSLTHPPRVFAANPDLDTALNGSQERPGAR